MKTQLKALGAILALAFSLNASATLVIDSFSTDQTKIFDSSIGGGGVSSEIAAAEALGGYRELYVEKLGGNANPNLVSSIGVAGDWLNFSNDSSVIGTGSVIWNGLGNAGLNGGLGLDLTSYGNAFILDVVNLDTSFTAELIATSVGNLVSSAVVSGSSIGLYSISFGGLVGSADLTQIISLELKLTGPASFDISVDSVDIPEPASLALVGLSLLGLGVMRRRQA